MVERRGVIVTPVLENILRVYSVDSCLNDGTCRDSFELATGHCRETDFATIT